MKRNSFFIVSKDLAADKRISATAKLTQAALLDHRNNKTGKCNPHQASIAEALGLDLRVLVRAIAELKRAGWLKIIRGQTGNRYEFPKCQFVVSEMPNRRVPHDVSVVSGAPTPLYEPYSLKGSARSRADHPQRKSVQREVMERYYAQQQRKAGI